MSVSAIDRCPTGIPELDELLGGGFPRGAVIVVAGAPGTGKTTFAAKFLYEGALRYGESGVFLSFLESKKDFLRFMNSLGMDFRELEDRNLFKFIEGFQAASEEGIREVIEALIEAITKLNAKRAVIDSISALTQVVKGNRVREVIKDAIINGLKRLNVTSILTLEVQLTAEPVRNLIEGYLADGLISLSMTTEKDYIVRKFEIKKMKGTPIPYSSIPFEIVPGDVIRLHPPVRLDEVPAPNEREVYRFDNELINKAFGGGIYRGAQIAVVQQIAGTCFIIPLCLAKALAMKYGGRLVIRSYSRSPAMLKVIEKLCDRIIEPQLVKDKDKKNYESWHISENPTTRPLYAIAVENRALDHKLREDFLVTGPLELVQADFPEFFKEHANNVWVRKKLGITAFYIFHYQTLEKHPELFDIYDYIIIVKHVYHSGKQCIEALVVNAINSAPPATLLLCYDPARKGYTLELKGR